MESSPQDPKAHAQKQRLLALAALGVVFGDIGTSPLYMMRETFGASGGMAMNQESVYGVLSLAFWSLMIVVSIKYCAFVMRADNKGEGGVLSLASLALRTGHAASGRRRMISIVALTGLALFYGDALITPSVSVLSAVEGLAGTRELKPYIVPIATVILLSLFLFQSRGTGKVGRFFGPIMLLWFSTIGFLGLLQIIERPHVLIALSPLYALDMAIAQPWTAFVALGSIVLCVTGAEALYADLGHFGKKPIQYAWLVIVLPALALNYLGQGAMLIATPEAIDNPFFRMVPEWGLVPMVVLATAATIIASQAVITGAYALTQQAIQLGLLPRMEIRFTSESHAGQTYLPQVNWLLMVGVILLVVSFQTSSALATAYGIAVTGTMVVTAIMAVAVMWKDWRWPLWAVLAIMLPLITLDVIFLGANALKIMDGGWMPLALGVAIFVFMWTWREGSRLLAEKTRISEVPLAGLVETLEQKPPHTVQGTAVFLTSDASSAPTALLHSLKHYKVLHERNVILKVRTSTLPRVPREQRLKIEQLSSRFWRVELSFGFMEQPNVPAALKNAPEGSLPFTLTDTSFFLSRRSVRASRYQGMPFWQDKLFIMMAKNANDASSYFRLPPGRVIEVGSQVTV